MSPQLTAGMISVTVVLVYCDDRTADIEDASAAIEGLPYEPVVPIAAADDKRRHGVIEAPGKDKEIDEVWHLPVAGGERQLAQVISPVAAAEVDGVVHVHVPAAANDEKAVAP